MLWGVDRDEIGRGEVLEMCKLWSFVAWGVVMGLMGFWLDYSVSSFLDCSYEEDFVNVCYRKYLH